jgi:hypothetical protein
MADEKLLVALEAALARQLRGPVEDHLPVAEPGTAQQPQRVAWVACQQSLVKAVEVASRCRLDGNAVSHDCSSPRPEPGATPAFLVDRLEVKRHHAS